MKTKTNAEAPGLLIKKGKLIYTAIRIQADVKQVWQVLTNFDAYPLWNPFVRQLTGHPAVGSRIKVHLQAPGAQLMVFKPKVLCFDKNKEFRWIGHLWFPGIFDGEHVFNLVENPDGSCTFQHYERFRGILVPFLRRLLETSTIAGFELLNQAIREKCETKK